jgi:hypothetical protein
MPSVQAAACMSKCAGEQKVTHGQEAGLWAIIQYVIIMFHVILLKLHKYFRSLDMKKAGAAICWSENIRSTFPMLFHNLEKATKPS